MTGTVLVTGAAGLLGTWILRTAPAGVEVVSLTHQRLVPGRAVAADLRDPAAVDAAFAGVEPRLVIHAAYAKGEASIVDATRHVAEAAARAGTAHVLVSTEAVFSGDGRPRDEAARPDPVWDYGRWKAAAEATAVEADPSATIVRLPLIVSLDPEDHIVADIQAGHAADEPSVWYTDEIRQPAYADELAHGLWAIAERAVADRAGVWHLPGPEQLSRFEIALRTADVLGLDRASIVGRPTPSGARRPRHLDLSGERAQREIRWSPRPVHRPA